MNNPEMGEKLYEYNLSITGMTEFGVSFESLMSGQIAPPPEGARFDVAFEGAATGTKLSGKVVGVDYVRMRGDGRIELDIHATITTDDGQNIALCANGVGLPRKDSPIADLRENVTLFTSSKDYAWVNPIQVWAIGTVDFANGIIHIAGYMA